MLVKNFSWNQKSAIICPATRRKNFLVQGGWGVPVVNCVNPPLDGYVCILTSCEVKTTRGLTLATPFRFTSGASLCLANIIPYMLLKLPPAEFHVKFT